MGSVPASRFKGMDVSRFSAKWPPIQDGRQNCQNIYNIPCTLIWVIMCEIFVKKAVSSFEELNKKELTQEEK